MVLKAVGDPELGGYRPLTKNDLLGYRRQLEPPPVKTLDNLSRTSMRGEIVVARSGRAEVFHSGEHYSVTIGNCTLPNQVRASAASWLAYAAFSNELDFHKT